MCYFIGEGFLFRFCLLIAPRHISAVHVQVQHSMYVCMVITYSRVWINQVSKATNSARGQLNRENKYIPVPVRALEFGLARRVRPSRPASAFSFSTLRLNLVLTDGIPPDFRRDVNSFIPPYMKYTKKATSSVLLHNIHQ